MSSTRQNRVLTARHGRAGAPVRADSPSPCTGRYGPLSGVTVGHGTAPPHTQDNLEKGGHYEDRVSFNR